MTLEELKAEIEKRTGIPAALLTGETLKENLDQARQLLDMRAEQPKSNREAFAAWLNGEDDPLDGILPAPIPDGGEAHVPDGGRNVRDQFAEWFIDQYGRKPNI